MNRDDPAMYVFYPGRGGWPRPPDQNRRTTMNRNDRHEPWWDRAACKNTPPDQVDRIFFPGLGKHGTRAPKLDEPAKLICTGYIGDHKIGPGCPVRLECLRWAIDHEILLGTYGGIPDHQRRKQFHHGARTDRGKTA